MGLMRDCDIILFDLDGTLTDSKPGITRSVQYALAKMGIVEPDLDKLAAFIGPPLIESFKEFYGLSDAEARQARRFYRERFAAVGMYENAVYPGIAEMLAELENKGKTMLVATAKPTEYSCKILEHFALRSFFWAIVGSNLDGTRTSKDEVIAAALAELGPAAARRRAVMVGDRWHDVAGARRNNIAALAVGYGYGSLEELRQARPDRLVVTVAELKEALLDPNGV